jgi:hypothetical protein
MRLEHPAVQVFVVRLDTAEQPVFCGRDARDDHRRLEQRSTLGRVHDHPVDKDTARNDVFPVQQRSTRPLRGGADVGRRYQSRPTPHDCVQDWADLQIVSDVSDVDCFDIPILCELGHSLGKGDELSSTLGPHGQSLSTLGPHGQSLSTFRLNGRSHPQNVSKVDPERHGEWRPPCELLRGSAPLAVPTTDVVDIRVHQ